jgi:hypothetical protein
MQQIFSTIYVRPKLFSEERFCIGVLAISNNIPSILMSDRKMKIACSFIEASERKYVLKALKNLEKEFAGFNLNSAQLALFDSQITETYLKSLGKKKGLVEFSSPTASTKHIDSAYMEYLFKRYVDTRIESKKAKVISFKKKISDMMKLSGIEALKSPYYIKPNSNNSLLTEIKVDGAGINNSQTLNVISVIDFKSSITTLERKFYDLKRISEHFDSLQEELKLESVEYLVVANPPKSRAQEELYKNFKNNPKFEVGTLKDLNNFVRTNSQLHSINF